MHGSVQKVQLKPGYGFTNDCEVYMFNSRGLADAACGFIILVQKVQLMPGYGFTHECKVYVARLMLTVVS